jgi:chemotaxis response regulator CheB
MNPIRVLVVDDSATVRRILRILISEDPELELVP